MLNISTFTRDYPVSQMRTTDLPMAVPSPTPGSKPSPGTILGCGQPIECGVERYLHPLARASRLEFDRASGDPARPDDELIWHADQIHRREFCAGRFVAIVVQDFDTGVEQLGVEVVGGAAAARVTRTQIDQTDTEGCDALRPDNAGIVVVGLDQRAYKARNADAVGAHFERHRLAVGTRHESAHRPRIFVAEIEDLADLDASPADDSVAVLRGRLRIMNVVGRRVDPGIAIDDLLDRGGFPADIVEFLPVRF